MNKLLFLCLMLSACGKPLPNNQEMIAVPDGSGGVTFIPNNGSSQSTCSSIEGTFQRVDGQIATVTWEVDHCMIQLSCGLHAHITAMIDPNQYFIQVSLNQGDIFGNCGIPNQGLQIGFGLYGNQWLGCFNNQCSNLSNGNEWVKL